MSANDGAALLPPLLPITPEDHGGYVVLSAVLLVILTSLVVGIAFISRIRIVGKPLASDWLLLLSTVLFLFEAICMRYASFNGLGRHRASLDQRSFEQYSKFLYTGQIVTHLSLTCTKLAMIVLIISIKPFRSILLACRAAAGAVCLWAIFGIVTLSFQCDQPKPWDFSPGRCMNQRALYIAIGIGSILTDIATTVLPCVMVWKVRLPLKKRATIAALFATRIIVVVFTTIYLVKLGPFFSSDPIDQPWNVVDPSVWSQAVLSLSIITACIPGLKRVLADLQTGLMSGAITEFYELSVSGGAGKSDITGTCCSSERMPGERRGDRRYSEIEATPRGRRSYAMNNRANQSDKGERRRGLKRREDKGDSMKYDTAGAIQVTYQRMKHGRT